MLKQLRSPQPTGPVQVPKPKTTIELALRKRMVRTGRELIPLRKPKNSKPKKPKDDIIRRQLSSGGKHG